MANDKFLTEQEIVIELENGDLFRFYMRPMKVKEIGLACRIAEFQKAGASEAEYLPLLLDLIEPAVNVKIDAFPLTTLNKLVEVYIDMNFPKPNKDKKGNLIKSKPKCHAPSPLAASFDFLIQQGHSMSDIMEYTIPQVQTLQQAAIDRLEGRKYVDPVTALSAAGVAIKR